MTALELLRLEAERRRRWRAAILSVYEVTDNPKDRVRRTEVLRVVAKAIGRWSCDNFFQARVIAEVTALGAVPIKPHNQRWYRNLKRRSQPGQG